MDKKTEKDLRAEFAESHQWDFNPLKRTILSLFEKELNNSVYKTLSPCDIYNIVKMAFTKDNLLERGGEKVLEKLQQASSTNDAIMILGDFL